MIDQLKGLVTYQTFGEGDKKQNKSLCKIIHSYDEKLFQDLNEKGAGIYFMFNEGNGKGRNNKSVIRIRGFFQEDDHNCDKELPLEPHFIVQTSPGKYHRHFLVDGLSPEDYKQIMSVMISDYGSDPNAKDLARVLRVPGFTNNKSNFKVELVHSSGKPPYSHDEVMEAFIDMPIIRRHVRDYATKTIDDPNYSRNVAIFQLGCQLGEEGVNENTLSKALRLFEEQMRPTDTSGQIKGMDFASELTTITRGWQKTSEERQRILDEMPVIENVEALKFPLLTYEQLMDRPVLKWYIKDLLPVAELGFIYGESGTGKTFFAIHLVKHLLSGHGRFFGKKVTDPVNVLYICAEGVSGFRDRLQLSINEMSFEEKNRLRIIDRKPGLNRISDVKEIINSCNHSRFVPNLVFIDTLAQTSGGANQDSNTEMQLYLDSVAKLNAAFNSMSIIIHHAGKDVSRGMRGASCLKGAADVSILLTGQKQGPKTALVDKLKDGADDLEMYFELKPEIIAVGFDEDGDDMSRSSCTLVELTEKPAEPVKNNSKRQTQVLEFVNGEDYVPMTSKALVKELCDLHHVEQSHVFTRCVKTLLDKGMLEEVNGFIEPSLF
jgi:AAA domain/RepB DNA-primase from phage plasmid